MTEMQRMTSKDLIKDLRDQGFRVDPTTKGVKAFAPDGRGSYPFHTSTVDSNKNNRGWENLITSLERIGYRPPWKREAPVKDPEKSGDKWITIKRAAEILDIDPTYAHSLKKRGLLGEHRFERLGSDGREIGVQVRESAVVEYGTAPRQQGRRTVIPGRETVPKPKKPRLERTKVAVYDPQRVAAAIGHMQRGLDILKDATIIADGQMYKFPTEGLEQGLESLAEAFHVGERKTSDAEPS